MARRQLPPRSTRGQLPPHLKNQPSPVKIIKQRKEDQQEIKRKQIEIKCKLNQINNLKKYPYSRAFHYFFDLNSLPRAKGTISYAQNTRNTLNNTFSKDSIVILGTMRKDILNRQLIGLPMNVTGEVPMRKENKCKNVCYLYLQEIQDKKYNTDRVIYTLKIILSKIKKKFQMQLGKYQFIKKDPDLQILLQQNMSLQEKISLITQKINNLQSRKDLNCINWKFEDQIYFYHALNQKLHNVVNDMKYKLTQEYHIKLLYEKEFIQYQYYSKKQQMAEFLQKVLNYYNKNILALSSDNIKYLIERAGFNLVDLGPQQKFYVNYPIAILQFGKDQLLHTLTEFLVGRRAFNLGQTHFYQIKEMIKKLFNRNLKVKSQKIITYDQYFKNFRKRYEQIRKNPKKKLKQQMETHFDYPKLDECLNKNVIDGKNQKILKLNNSIEITKREYIFLMLYYWLLQCIAVLYPYIIQYRDLLDIIGSDFFPKVCNSLVQAIGQPTIGLFFYIFEAFTQLMSKSNQLSSINIKLIYEYDAKLKIGIIWRQQPELVDDQVKNGLLQQQFKALPLKKIKQK